MLNTYLTRTGTATVEGRFTVPEVWVTCDYHARHPKSGKLMRDLFKALPGARWNKTRSQWLLTGTPSNPDKWFHDAGIDVTIDQACHPGVTSLQELYTPMSMLAPNGRQVLIRHRLAGFVATGFLLGWAATWDRTVGMYKIPVTDVYQNGSPRPGVLWDQESVQAAYDALTTSVSTPGWEQLAADFSRAVSVDPDYMEQVGEALAKLPEWWDREPFPFQTPGAYAALLGHRLIADAPGLGKSTQAIAAAALQGAERILISCPPLLAVNWGREFEKCGYPGKVAVFRAGRKAPAFPEAGVVVIPDSLLTNRAELRQQVIDWAPQYFSVDEAHRMKNWDSKRSQALLDVAASVRKNGGICVPLTGTPIISGPHELVPILEFAGLLGPVFGGSDAFLQRFCTKDPFGKFKPRMANLGELNMLLTQHCWVRREKARVLPWLPKRTLSAVQLEVDTKPYREAHEEVMVAIGEWMDQFREEWGSLPDDEAIDDFAANSLGLVSQLRVASAVCKIPAATEMIADHLAADPENEFPLVVWVHHAEVANAIAEQMEELEVPYGMIVGGVSDKKRNEAVDKYQAGELRVMIASLTAAGVGVTLTRGCDALFVETDWTPANVTQAIDRQHRIGQERPVLARTLIAMNTLDERIQKIQHIKQTVAGKVTGDDQANVALLTQQGLVTPQEIIRELAANVLAARKRTLA